MAASSNVRALELELELAQSGSVRVHSTSRLGILFREHAAFIARALRRFGVPAVEIEDAVQEVFIVASRKLGDIAEGAERAFIYSTAVRIASNVRRVQARSSARRADAPIERVETEVDTGPNAEDLVEQRRAREALDAVLDTMTVEMRAVFTLYEIEELTLAEIAELLGVPLSTVSSRLRRARDHFDHQVHLMEEQLRGKGRTP